MKNTKTKQAYKILTAIHIRRCFDVLKVIAENPGINVTNIFIKLRYNSQSDLSRVINHILKREWVQYMKEGKKHNYVITDKAVQFATAINKIAQNDSKQEDNDKVS